MSINIFLDKAHICSNNLLESFPEQDYGKIHKEVVSFLSKYSEKICNYKVNSIVEIDEINESLFWEIYPETKLSELCEINEENIELEYLLNVFKNEDIYQHYKNFSSDELNKEKRILSEKFETVLIKLKNSFNELIKEEITCIIQEIILSYIEDIISERIVSNIIDRNCFEP